MSRVWAVVPAAGSGRRMGSELPKQYLALAGRTVLEHTLARLGEVAAIARIVVALAADDRRYARLAVPARCTAASGGAERCHSVLAGLQSLVGEAAHDDWVLVHDAARPCVRVADIERLLAELAADAVGGILAVPVRDTLKRCAPDGAITDTVSREALWQAQTPQLFRYGLLRAALEAALTHGGLVTDEAQAVEWAGATPRVVAGHGDNLKITHPEDLALAALILAAQRVGEP